MRKDRTEPDQVKAAPRRINDRAATKMFNAPSHTCRIVIAYGDIRAWERCTKVPSDPPVAATEIQDAGYLGVAARILEPSEQGRQDYADCRTPDTEIVAGEASIIHHIVRRDGVRHSQRSNPLD
jgi:hypothetical protein